jgi:tetratricopeptide (TPR) repeat protein
MVYFVCKEVTGRCRLAAVAAGLFAVHPVHVESVAWISGVTDPLAALFLLPAFYCYLRYRKGGRPALIAASLVLYLFALWSKETAVAMTLVVGYCELFHFTETAPLRRRITRLAAMACLFAVPTIFYLLTRLNAIGTLIAQDELRYPLGAVLKTIPIVAAKYLALLALPFGYSYQHHTPFVDSVASIEFLAPLLLLAALAAGVALSRSKELRWAALWFIAFLAPALAALRNFDPEYLVQERYLYLPSLGFCLAVALAVEWLASRKLLRVPGRVAATALGCALVVAWGVASAIHNRTWDNTITVFRHCVATDPMSAPARSALASTYFFAGRPREAETEARRALELDSKYGNAYLNLSYFSHRQGNLDKAIEYLEQAKSEISQNPITRSNLATIHLNVGLLYAQRKDYRRAEENIRKSIEMWSRAVGWFYAGQMYFQSDRYQEALDMYREASRHVPPKYAPIHLAVAAVYEKLGDRRRAQAEYARYLELAIPDSPDVKQVEQRLRQLESNQPPQNN